MMGNNIIFELTKEQDLKNIAETIIKGDRITKEQALYLFENAETGYLAILANEIKYRKNKDIVYYNQNVHIEPTNICRYHCNFCSYSAKPGDKDSWEYSIDDIISGLGAYKEKKITEVHIVGGVHPDRNVYYYGEMIKAIKNVLKKVHVKAFTAVELEYMIQKAGISIEKGLKYLKDCGLNSLPGGGAEIFDETIRENICPDKTKSSNWLKIHELAHQQGIPSNATILYGHIEEYKHRADHLNRLRELQDKTGKFNAFIPLKFKKYNNPLSDKGEVSIIEDLRNYAISRIFLDNIDHIKAYWPMIGKEAAQLSLQFGVDDIDGTINDSTKIYSRAGSYKHPSMSINEINELIIKAGMKPVERDSLYNPIT